MTYVHTITYRFLIASLLFCSCFAASCSTLCRMILRGIGKLPVVNRVDLSPPDHVGFTPDCRREDACWIWSQRANFGLMHRSNASFDQLVGASE